MQNIPKHIAIILDGNGRWAKKQNKKRTFGHKAGAKNIKTIVDAALKQNIKYLTLFCFSTENWNRPKEEVVFLMNLPKEIINNKKAKSLEDRNIRFKWLGFEDKLPKTLVKLFKDTESKTKDRDGLNLTIAFNYGSQKELVHAFKEIDKKKTNISYEDIKDKLLTSSLPDVDLLIRTGGEQRLSNFLLLQAAYAELIFNKKMWPEYSEEDFINDIKEFSNRTRRFGRI